MKKKNKGITLVALVVTIIVLLILAGISLSIITNSGVFEKANKAKKVNMLAVAREEVSLAIDTHITDSYINNKKITPKMISDEVNKSNNRETHAENEEQFPTYIIYPETDTKIGEEIQVKIGENLEILEVRLENGKQVDLKNKFNKYIYIDAVNGNDDEGNGSSESPYQTLDKIAESGIIENGYTYGIILKSGTYTLSTKIFELNCNKSINIFGNREKTILNVTSLYPNSSGGSTNYNINLYRLIWHGTKAETNGIFLKTSVYFYNIVFDMDFTEAATSYFLTYNSTYTFKNCTLPTNVASLLRSYRGYDKTPSGYIYLTNCYGGFQTSIWGINSNWNYQTNYITSTPQVDSTTYRITEDSSIWKDVGTGEDLDESPADLGVYGGEYSWEYETDLN